MNPGTGAIVFWASVMAAMFVALIAAIVLVKRWMVDARDSSSSAWTLHDLNQLRDTGEITIQEYERLRARTVAGVRSSGGLRGARASAAGAKLRSDLGDGGVPFIGWDGGGSVDDGGAAFGSDGGDAASDGGSCGDGGGAD
ncbi:MAG: hypothetical protein HOP29_17050 [Phycisphaerales bacterium]|nr:hypothetical protein [Phycisphaerales bacterium]